MSARKKQPAKGSSGIPQESTQAPESSLNLDVNSRATSNSPRSHQRVTLTFVVRALIGLVFLAVVLASIDLNRVFGAFASIHPVVASFVCAVSVIERMLMAYKWNLLLRARGIYVSVWQAIRLCFVGHLTGALTPGGLGGDAYRIAALWRFRKTADVVSTIVLERLVGLAVLSVVIAIMLPISIRYLGVGSSRLAIAIVVGAVVAVVIVLLSLRRSFIEGIARQIPFISRLRILTRVRDFYEVYAESRHHPLTLIAFSLLAVIQIVAQVCVAYLAARSLGIEISFTYLLAVIPLALGAMRLPISIQGIGVLEGLLAYFFHLGGYSAEDGVSVALLTRAVGILGSYLPAAIMMLISPVRVDPEYKRP